MKATYLTVLFVSALTSLRAETLPAEVASAKEAFEKNVASFSTEPLENLNEKYTAVLEAAKQRAQDDGKLENLLAITRELESIAEGGQPSDEAVAEGGEFGKLRKIYISERARVEETRQTAFQAAFVKYQQKLNELVKEFTKAGRIDDAIATQNELKSSSSIELVNSPIVQTPQNAATPIPVEKRAGRLRGFGRTSGLRPADAEIDLSKFEKYDDFVDIAGGQRDILLLRENGDVLDENGDTVGKNAVSIIPTGYIDTGGEYHTTAGLRFPDSAQPLVTLDHALLHGLALRADGTLHSWKEEYETGKRAIPDQAKTNIVQIGCRRHDDWALNSKGELFRWNTEGSLEVPASIRSGVSRLETSNFHSAFVLTLANEVYDLEGNRPDAWRNEAKNLLVGGALWAVLDLDDRWHAFVLENNEPIANELDVLNAVLNRSETIDVAFHTYAGKDIYFGNYVFWIEETDALELDLNDPLALKAAAKKPRQPGTGFSGFPIE